MGPLALLFTTQRATKSLLFFSFAQLFNDQQRCGEPKEYFLERISNSLGRHPFPPLFH